MLYFTQVLKKSLAQQHYSHHICHMSILAKVKIATVGGIKDFSLIREPYVWFTKSSAERQRAYICFLIKSLMF